MLRRFNGVFNRDAFRAAGYGPGDMEGFAKVIEHRIAQLRML
jgi:hypothetical protein